MASLWPHSAFAEDQPLARCILTTHVLHRGFQAGAIIGSLVGAARIGLRARSSKTSPQLRQPIPRAHTILRAAGLGGAIGVGLSGLATLGRMWGREHIEWQDRAWRLLENAGQVSVDRWSTVGMAVGVGTMGFKYVARDWRIALGAAGAGSFIGVMGSMGYRAANL